MPKYAAKVDRNQPEIVAAYRKAGASVAITSTAGQGFPDLVVGYRGVSYLIEVKDGELPPSARKLTPAQVKFRDDWRGHYAVVKSVEEALAVIGVSLA